MFIRVCCVQGGCELNQFCICKMFEASLLQWLSNVTCSTAVITLHSWKPEKKKDIRNFFFLIQSEWGGTETKSLKIICKGVKDQQLCRICFSSLDYFPYSKNTALGIHNFQSDLIETHIVRLFLWRLLWPKNKILKRCQ